MFTVLVLLPAVKEILYPIVSPSGEGGIHDTLMLATPSCIALTSVGLDATEKMKWYSYNYTGARFCLLTMTSDAGNRLAVDPNTNAVDCCHLNGVLCCLFEL